jgi:hypothetical protein
MKAVRGLAPKEATMSALSETRNQDVTYPPRVAVNEMLRCDVYEVPREFWGESAFRIPAVYPVCSYCGRMGEDRESIQHERECPLANDGSEVVN